MQQVAARAGVSPMTVSRVINADPAVSAKNRQLVLEAAQELKYKPNRSARSLASSRSYMISLLLHDSLRNCLYVTDLLAGALEACKQAGFHIAIENCVLDEDHSEPSILERLSTSHYDGIILTERASNFDSVKKALAKLEIKHVRISPEPKAHSSPYVCIDNYQAAYDMTSYLISLGHSNIGFIKGNNAEYVTHLRYDGYRDALANHGIKLSSRNVLQGDYLSESAFRLSSKLLSKRSRPTAIFASNDAMAAGVIAAAYKLGISMPDELSVAGFDNSGLTKITTPKLTTVDQRIAELGYAAVEMLIQIINDESILNRETPLRRILEHELVVRESTSKPPRTEF